MKKSLIALTLSSLFALSASAQKGKVSSTSIGSGPYLRVGVGFAFPHAGNTYGDETTLPGTTSYELQKYSYGAGLNTAVGFGYWFTENLGFELAANIGVAPKKYEAVSTYAEPGVVYTATDTWTKYAKTPIYLMPSAMIKTGGTEFNIYARLGLAINIAGKTITEFERDNKASVLFVKEEYRYRTGIGFQGAMGMSVVAGKNVSLFAEVNGISMNQYVKKSEVTEFAVNGVDILSSVPVADKQYEYEMNFTDVTPANPKNPTQLPAYAEPFSNIGFAAGIIIYLK